MNEHGVMRATRGVQVMPYFFSKASSTGLDLFYNVTVTTCRFGLSYRNIVILGVRHNIGGIWGFSFFSFV